MSADVLLPTILLLAATLWLARVSRVARQPAPDVAAGGSGPPSADAASAADFDRVAGRGGGARAHGAAWMLRPLRGAAMPGSGAFYGVCELDGFEKIRKHVGYKAANALVTAVAEEIRQRLPRCRIGRTNRTTVEFAWSQACTYEAHALVATLRAALPDSFDLEGCALDVRPRIAFQRISHGMPAEGALEMIDAALADPARHPLDLIAVPEEEASASDERLYLLKELSAAITHDRLEVHYQPKLDCRSERISSVEALLRWTHGALGAIGPDRIVAAAEDTGLIRRLTIWVLQRVLADLATLAAADVAVPVYVNISGLLLPDERFAARVIDLLHGHETLVGFEITETAVIRDPDRAMANLARFRAAGISIAIDDYGTGLSSLAYLKQLPAQELKIDRLFISGLTTEHRDPLLVRSSIDLAHALEMKVTAEGVDSPMALSLLTIMGCDMVQGFLVSRPLPLTALVAFLARDSHVAHIQTAPIPMFGRPPTPISLTKP